MANKNSYDIIKSLLRTEKATLLEPLKKYLFLVAKDANKIEIRKAVEDVYKVKVVSVNTKNSVGKLRRVRYQPGYETNQKKAWVTLGEGSKIETT